MAKSVLLLWPIVLLMLGAAASGEEEKPKFTLPHITVDGYAAMEVKPDMARLRLGVVDERRTAAEAAEQNAKESASVIADLKAQGIDPKDIRTITLSLEPILLETRDPRTQLVTQRTLTGYRAANLVEVRIRDVDRAGSIVRHVVERGANTFDSLSFTVEDSRKRIDQLRSKAVADAKQRAALYGQGAAMKLGRLLAIDPEPDRNASGEADLPLARSPRSIPIPVEPGLQTLSAHVTATWELIPK